MGARHQASILRDDLQCAELVGGAGEFEHFAEAAELRHEFPQQHAEYDHQADQDDDHLLDVGPDYCRDAADHRVGRGQHADDDHGDDQVDVEDGTEGDRRGVDDGAERQASRAQENQARQRARHRAEALFEQLVRGQHIPAAEIRHQEDAQDHHRER